MCEFPTDNKTACLFVQIIWSRKALKWDTIVDFDDSPGQESRATHQNHGYWHADVMDIL
jgi:hypothetical protein